MNILKLKGPKWIYHKHKNAKGQFNYNYVFVDIYIYIYIGLENPTKNWKQYTRYLISGF